VSSVPFGAAGPCTRAENALNCGCRFTGVRLCIMAQTLDAALSPAFTVPPHVIDESGAVAAWFTEPPGVVLQFIRPARGTTELAKWVVGPAYNQLVRRFPDGYELRIVLDMRQMTGRAATARAVLIDHGKLVSQRLGRVIILPSVHMGAVYLKVVETTALMLRAFGVRIEIEQSLERALAKQDVRLATPFEPSRAAGAARNVAGTGRAQV
jgi:hypothetical protein